MKRTCAIALFSIAGLFTSGTAPAQGREVQAVIPFGFAVDGQLLPAGTYIVTPPLQGSVTIRSADKRSTMSAVTLQTDRVLAAGGRLVFDKYGDHYFLHQALCPPDAMDMETLPVNAAKARLLEGRPWAGETTSVATTRVVAR